ncbi:hypothetical protein Pryu01_02242 [Paraliobacillus ryukyuensis]|uniref:Uncharacterized protein n=1 Tax=Paraliobacillus ryukyuensis TaxID=200904 RepID=A0A366E6J3_9BACI|nr:hypothetical protein DES48_10630 [Paraliobacillus ryukyuensis]
MTEKPIPFIWVGAWRALNSVIMSYEEYEKYHRITHEFWGGYVRHKTMYRKVYNGQNAVIDDAYIAESHMLMMYVHC